MRSHTTPKGLAMLILAIVSTFVLSCTLILLRQKVRNAKDVTSSLWRIYSGVRIRYDREMSVYHDDKLTLEEKYKKIYRQ